MKRIKLQPILRLTGRKFKIPVFDVNEELELDEKGMPKTSETTSLLDLLEYFILRGLPRDKYTKLDSIRVGNVYRSIQSARKNKAEVLELDEEEHKWLRSKLEDDGIGVRMFTHDTQILLEALDDFERLHEPKSKEA